MTQAIYEGFILSRQQLTYRGKLRLCYWLHSRQGPIQAFVDSERALFFIRQSDVALCSLILSKANITCNLKPTQLKHFDSEAMYACYFDNSKNLFEAKSSLKNKVSLYEDDIRHSDRFLMERFIKGSVFVTGKATRKNGFLAIECAQFKEAPQYKPNLKVLSVDIECSGEGVLFSIGCVSSSSSRVIMIGEPQPTSQNIAWVTDETQLLQHFIEYIQTHDPDVLIGWNIIDFDCAVLADRAEALDVPLLLGRDQQAMTIYKGNHTRVSLPGRTVVDGISTLKNATYYFESFKLSFVANDVLGETKLIQSDDRLEEIVRQFNDDKLSLAAYNQQDCQLVLDIFKKLNLLEFAINRTQLTGLEIERMGGSVAAFTNLYLPLLHRSGYVAPNLAEHGLDFESPGGFVMESNPGRYKNVVVLDFKSLYPSIIRTFCIDPMGLIEGVNDKGSAIAGYNGGYFSRGAHHLPELVKTLSKAREQAKINHDLMLSQAIKIIMNSLYGVLGSKGCRFYDPRLSSSITLRGHEIMQSTKRHIESMGFEVIYGDTDSTFVKLPEHWSREACIKSSKDIVKKINGFWQLECKNMYTLESFLEIEFECLYSPFFMPTVRGQETGSKKRYVGQIENNGKKELIFKGVESVRSDWTAIAKQFQQALFHTYFNNGDLLKLVHQYIDEVNSGQVDAQLIYCKRMSKPVEGYIKTTPPHVKAMKHALECGQVSKTYKNMTVNYYMSTSGPRLYLNDFKYKIDYNHYIEKQIMPIYSMLTEYDKRLFNMSNQSKFEF